MKAELGLGGYFSNPIDNPVHIIRKAYELGIRFFDTSPAYGDSELWIHEALMHEERNTIKLSTKTKARTADELSESLESSLKRLKTGYIDVYFGHDYINSVEEWEVFGHDMVKAMRQYKLTGMIDKIGVSGHSIEAAYAAIDSLMVDYIMIPHSIGHRKFDDVIKYANDNGVLVITMKNLGSGIILGGPDNSFKGNINLKDVLGFSSYFHGVQSIIPSARSIKQVEELVRAYTKCESISDSKILEMEHFLEDFYGEDYCRFCNECRPCDTYGWRMSQPGILKSMMYHQRLNINMTNTYSDYVLNGTDCIPCDNLCSKRCPHDINIKQKLLGADYFFKGGE